MPLTLVRPSQIGYGDSVNIDNQHWIVTGIEGPDSIGAYDLYLIGQDGLPAHKVVVEPIQLEL
jgi:hypothetical protein